MGALEHRTTTMKILKLMKRKRRKVKTKMVRKSPMMSKVRKNKEIMKRNK